MSIFSQLTLCVALFAQTEPPLESRPKKFDGVQQKLWAQAYHQIADQYQISVGEVESPQLKLMPNLAYYWCAPEFDIEYNGGLFVWAYEGRPHVIGSIWSHPPPENSETRQLTHEFVSLSLGPVKAVEGKETVWAPNYRAIRPSAIPEAAKPARSAPERLKQMQKLAQKFSATESFSNIANGAATQLQIRQEPIFRFQQGNTNTRDGAVFAMLFGLDPEAFLMIEEVPSPGGSKWYYSITRFGRGEIEVFHGDESVWKYEESRNLTDPSSAHLCRFRETTMKRYLTEADLKLAE